MPQKKKDDLAQKLYEAFLKGNDPMSRTNLQPQPKELTLSQLVEEGNRLLEMEEKYKKSAPKPTGKTSSVETSENPYVIARNQILKEMDEFHREEIKEMEASGNINNRFYDEFVKKVRIRGEEIEKKN